MRLKIFIASFTLLAIGVSAMAQNNSLNGTWVLDSVRIIKQSDNSNVDVNLFKDNPYFESFEKLKFQGNEMTITKNGNPSILTAQITNNKITAAFLAHIEADYKIKNGVLFLEQHITFPSKGHPQSETYTMLTQYKKQ